MQNAVAIPRCYRKRRVRCAPMGFGLGLRLSHGTAVGQAGPAFPALATALAFRYVSRVGATPGATFTWADQGPGAHNATQAAGGNQPTLNAGGFKGQSFVTFGATKWLSASFSIATPCELFCAFKTTTPASNQYVSDFGTNSLILNINTNNFNLYSGGTAFGTGPVSANTIHYANGQYNGASSVVSLDAGSDVTGSPGIGGETGTFTVGNVGSHNTGLLGDLYEVFGFGSILSSGDRTSVKAYLAGWYS